MYSTSNTESYNNNNNSLNTDSAIISNLITDLFSQSNMGLVILFLATYFVLYFGLGVYFNKNENPIGAQIAVSKAIDFLVIGVFIFLLFSHYFALSENDKNHLFGYILQWSKDFLNDPKTIIELILSIILFYAFVYLCNVPMTYETRPISIGFIENKLWILLATQIILDFFKYVFGINIVDLLLGDSLINWLNSSQYISNNNNVSKNDTSNNDISNNQVKPQIDEVFNVTNNLYTYDDAQAICSAYDAKLASYDQIEDSYNNGGEWCNYGWSDGQMALFPTQKNTWDSLQKTDNHKNDCGRPGINGGYISNPYVKFGVNCYGKKPKASENDLLRMSANVNKSYPKNLEDQVLDAKVKYWKDNASKMLNLNSYNKNKWSEY